MSICFNLQALPAHKWVIMEYLKTLICCALLANHLLRAFYSAAVCGAFVCSGTDRCKRGGEGCLTWQMSCRGCADVPDGYQLRKELVRRGGDLPVAGRPSISKHLREFQTLTGAALQWSGLCPWQPCPLLLHARELKPWSL